MENHSYALTVLLLCLRLASFQEVVHSVNGNGERLLGVEVSGSGELLVRSSVSVLVVDPSGGGRVVSTLNEAAIVFQQSNNLSSTAALRCNGSTCGLHSLNDLRLELWSPRVSLMGQSVDGLSHSIIKQLNATVVSLRTAEVVGGEYLDARIYDFVFASSSFTTVAPTSVNYRTTDTNLICTGCTAKFLEIFSPQSEAAERNPYTFYLETLSGSSDNDVTLLMRTCNTQSEITVQGRQGLFINKLRATLRSITCGGLKVADKAHFSEDLSNSTGSLLFTAFGGSICMHRYSDLRTAFEAVDTNCVADDKALSGDTVSSPQPIVQVVGSDIAAVGGMVVRGFHFLMVALQNRTILQYYVNNGAAILVDKQQLPVDSGVAMEIDAGRDGLNYYVTTPQKIYRFSLDNCGVHSSCSVCVQSTNPLCGWCSTEGQCMPQNGCNLANTFTDHNNAASCPAIVSVSPMEAYIVNNETITLTTMFVPGTGSSYECRFAFPTNTFTITATNNGSGMFTCTSPPEDQLRPIVQASRGAAIPELQLYGQFEGSAVLLTVTETLTYFDCRSFVQCGDCVQQETCEWCSRDLECKPRGSNSCTPNSNNIIYMSDMSGRCPQIVPTPRAEAYSFPAHTNMTTTIDVHVTFADNSIPSSIGDPYTCTYGDQMSTLGTVMNSSTAGGLAKIVIRCQQREFRSRMSSSPENLTLSITFERSGQMYELDNPMELNVFVYDCASGELSRDCSECASLPRELSCGYCTSRMQCLQRSLCDTPAAGSFIDSKQDTGQCPLSIEFTPTAGPIEGGTKVTITGANLPLTLDSVDSVMVAGTQCTLNSSDFQPATQLVCTTSSQNNPNTGAVQVNFRDATSRSRTVSSTQEFSFTRLGMPDVSPGTGIAAGGTVLTLSSLSLLVGSSHRITIGGQECAVVRTNSQEGPLQCRTPPGVTSSPVTIAVTVDGWSSEETIQFSYVENPTVESVAPLHSFQSGGIPITVHGSGFSNVQTAQIVFTSQSSRQMRQTDTPFLGSVSSTCIIQQPPNDTAIVCPSPATHIGTTTDTVTVSIQLDGLNVTSDMVNRTVTIYENPTFLPIGSTIMQQQTNLQEISIEATGIQPDLVRPYLRVFIGREPLCTITSVTETRIVCHPVNITLDPYTVPNSVHNITVHLGNQMTVVGLITFQAPFDYLLFVVLPVLGGVLLCAVLLLVVGCCVCQRRVRKKTRLLDELQEELHQVEASVVKTVKTGFAELHAEVEETAGDQMSHHLPFRDLPSYVYLNFFQEDKPSVILQPLEGAPGRTKEFSDGLSDFRRLLLDKKFLVTVIRTLEHQTSFDIGSRCHFATLLMVLLSTRLDYATDILKQLLSDQIRQQASKGESHLFMRKTQSVGDKMLTCWLALCLREHVEDTAAPALYMLLRATKSQLDKGPVDVVTGEARYSLSERTILRSLIDNVQEVTATVETDDGGRFPIKLLDCDTISQAKEKIMDVAFKSVKSSQRHRLSEIDVEYRFETTVLILRDEDKSSVVEGPWRRINTLKHYRVSLKDAVFRLVPRKEKPSNGHVFDHPGTLVASHAGTLRFRKRMSSITSDGLHLWHLTKQMDASANGTSPFAGRKLMTEIFFPQMMYTKNVLQKFVDDFVDSVFNTSLHNSSHGAAAAVYANLGTVSVPPAIKFLFDFLDQEAAENGIHHPNILHVWKCNSLSLRFWVNLVKNPEFVFDVGKSHTVDACLSVVAQALMDSCSLTEDKLTRDAPAGRLLFHKDVQRYRQTIKKYYDDVRRLPPIMPQQMKAHLAKLSQTYNQELVMPQNGVNMDRVLYGLLGFVSKYSGELVESLEAAGLLHQMQTLISIRKVVA